MYRTSYQNHELQNPTYVGIPTTFWICKNCKTHNQHNENSCWICKKHKAKARWKPNKGD